MMLHVSSEPLDALIPLNDENAADDENKFDIFAVRKTCHAC